MGGWWHAQRGDLAKDAIIGVVGVVGSFRCRGGMPTEARQDALASAIADRQDALASAIADRQDDLARNLANQAEVLENIPVRPVGRHVEGRDAEAFRQYESERRESSEDSCSIAPT